MNFQAFSNLRSLFVKVILTFFIGLFSFCYILLFLFIFLFSSIDSHCFILDADLQLYTTLFKTDFKTAFYKWFLLRSLQSHFYFVFVKHFVALILITVRKLLKSLHTFYCYE